MKLRTARMLIVGVVGSTLVLVGIPLWISPIPGGALVVPFGLALLASEFVWARRLLHRVRETTGNAMGRGIFPAREEKRLREPQPPGTSQSRPGTAEPLPETE